MLTGRVPLADDTIKAHRCQHMSIFLESWKGKGGNSHACVRERMRRRGFFAVNNSVMNIHRVSKLCYIAAVTTAAVYNDQGKVRKFK